MKPKLHLSNNTERNEIYDTFLDSCRKNNKTVGDIIKLGTKLMRKHKLHHHFYGDSNFFGLYSLAGTAKGLTLFALTSHKPQVCITPKDTISELEAKDVLELFEKRITKRVPVEYITNEAIYAGHKFYVNEHVLVPRSLMSDRFRDFLNNIAWNNYHVLDLCTGSGCIGITLALLNPKIFVDLADISPEALDVARINIGKHSLEKRVRCVQSNCFENIQGKYDLIITNPPYVSTEDYNKCPAEFINEPHKALESGSDGLELITKILKQAKSYLNPSGVLIAEVGAASAKLIKRKFSNVRFQWFNYRKPNWGRSIFDYLELLNFFDDDDCVFLCARDELEKL